MCKITHGAIIFAEIPYTEYNPHQHHGKLRRDGSARPGVAEKGTENGTGQRRGEAAQYGQHGHQGGIKNAYQCMENR